MSTDLPGDLQKAVDHLRMIFSAQLGPGDYAGALESLEELVTPYRAAQQAYAAGNGLYSPHPAFHVRSKGDKVWTSWPDDKPMPTLMDLLMLAHGKKSDPAKPREDT